MCLSAGPSGSEAVSTGGQHGQGNRSAVSGAERSRRPRASSMQEQSSTSPPHPTPAGSSPTSRGQSMERPSPWMLPRAWSLTLRQPARAHSRWPSCPNPEPVHNAPGSLGFQTQVRVRSRMLGSLQSRSRSGAKAQLACSRLCPLPWER